MRHWVITAAFPHRFSSEPTTNSVRLRIAASPTSPTIDHAVAFFERVLSRGAPCRTERVAERVRLEGILNLHDVDGMKDVAQISGMTGQILSGNEVLHPSGLPNAKIVLTGPGERLLFDGHHTVIAYMATGREYLDEIPHLVVQGGNGHVEAASVLAFFGIHAKKLSALNWRDHVIRWRAPPDRQLCKRNLKSMGELFESLARCGPWSDEEPGVRARPAHGTAWPGGRRESTSDPAACAEAGRRTESQCAIG